MHCRVLRFCWTDALYDACRDTSSPRSNLEDGFLNVWAPSMGDLAVGTLPGKELRLRRAGNCQMKLGCLHSGTW